MNRRYGWLWLGVLCIGFVMLLGGCASDSSDGDKDTLVLGFGGELDNMYPTMTSFQNLQATELVYDTLVGFENGTVIPRLATSWSFNEAGNELTLNLRKDVRFHDGEVFDADAVAANLAYYRLEPNASFIKGVSMIQDLQVIDAHTIKLVYDQPYYAILQDLTTPHILAMVSPKTIIPGNYERMEATIGTGPYTYASFVKGEHTVFEAFPEYWGEAPPFKTVIAKYVPDASSRLKALQTGEIDMVFGSSLLTFDDYQQALALTGIAGQISEGTLKTRALTLHASGSRLSDHRVREAIAYAIDREEIAQGLTYGYEQAADQLFDEDVPYGRNEAASVRSYDPARAGQLLEEAGWQLDAATGIRVKDGERLQLVFTYDSGEAINKAIVTALSSQLQQVGIGIEERAQDMMLWWMDSLGGNFDLTIWSTSGPTQDPHNFINPMLDSTAHTAAIGGMDEGTAFMERIQQSFIVGDPAEVSGHYLYFTSFLHNEAVVVPLTYAKELVVYRESAVSDYRFGGVTNLFDPHGVSR